MTAFGYVNQDQFVPPQRSVLIHTSMLMSMPSADAPGKTVADIAAAKRLARSHPEHVESVRQNGVTNPVVVRRGQVVDGHHRIVAAHDAGVKRIPVVSLHE